MKTKTLYHCQPCLRWTGTNQKCPSCGKLTEAKEVPNRRAGLYYVGEVDQPLTSVTTILHSVLNKPQLDYWKRKKVAEAVFADPTIEMDEAIKAPDKVRDKAGRKGQDIHNIVEAHAKGINLRTEDFDEPWRGYVEAYHKFCSEIPHGIVSYEQTVFSKEHLFAGTLDALIDINKTIYLIDYKTNNEIYPNMIKEFAMQLGAYREALYENGINKLGVKCAIVHLKKDGTYSFINIEPKFDEFLAVKKIYDYLNQ